MKDNRKVRNKKSDVKMYKKVEFEVEKSLQGRRDRLKNKLPTSVALDRETIEQLKALAEVKGIPYQVLMRSYILKGLREDLAS